MYEDQASCPIHPGHRFTIYFTDNARSIFGAAEAVLTEMIGRSTTLVHLGGGHTAQQASVNISIETFCFS